MALAVLEAVLEESASPDQAFTAQLAKTKLSESDRGLAWHIVHTTLRYRREADAAATPHLRDPDALPTAIHLLLWMGYVQLQVMEMPAHAVISTTVELSKREAGGHLSGLVNAVMRKLASAGAPDDIDRGLVNLAPWLKARWQDIYGKAQATAIASQMLVPPLLDATVKGDASAWAEQVGGIMLPNGSVRLPSATDVTQLPGFGEGRFWVQDAAAALPISLLGNLSGKSVIEVGAAPGGKTAQLAAAGAKVTALDISESRVERLRANLVRLKLFADIVVTDALQYKPPAAVDLVVLDAPCSATGTLRRHPELGWQKDADDVTRLASLQAQLLDHAAGWIKPGGELLFMTCSLEPEEGEAQLKGFLQRHSDYKVEPLTPPFGTVQADGSLRLLPTDLKQVGGNDGFFVARLRRS